MASTSMPGHLLLQECTPPAPNRGTRMADWLPDFVGFSWLAYGAGTSLVISTTPTPTRKEEAAVGPLFRQVIDTQHLESKQEASLLSCVGWAPPGQYVGLLAAAVGEYVLVYEPKLSGSSHDPGRRFSEFPVAWSSKKTLTHSFQVLSFAWTESGDGLISVGTEVVMWKHSGLDWFCLWRSKAELAQLLSAATWSAKGFAATASGGFEESTCQSSERSVHAGSLKGKTIVWWWEDSLGLKEVELLHPQRVLMVQWRPSKGPDCLEEPHRSVLLTACQDGAIRLWLEIDSGKARRDKALGKDVADRYLKPAFFVSAVVEANQCLNGTLGKDVFVTWASEIFVGNSGSVQASETTDEIIMSRGHRAGNCEWLLGIGPDGAVALWSLFCLDDIYPTRCPRVYLWKQVTELIPHVRVTERFPTAKEHGLILFKAFAQRIAGQSSDPPSSLDFFGMIPQGIFQWSRIWPPVSAMGGGVLKSTAATVGSGSRLLTGSEASGRKTTWGAATECLQVDGHSSEIVVVALHPVCSAGLAASLDTEGVVLLWSISSFSDIAIAVSVLNSPIWKTFGRLEGHQKFKMLNWLPAMLPGDRAVLLLGHPQGVDCFLVMKDGTNTGAKMGLSSFWFNDLCSFNLGPSHYGESLEGIWALPTHICHESGLSRSRFLIMGLVQGGCMLISWKLDVCVSEAANGLSTDILSDLEKVNLQESQDWKPCTVEQSTTHESSMSATECHVTAKAFLFGTMMLEELERVTSIAVVRSHFLPLENQSDCLSVGPLAMDRCYDFATGSADGKLKLWKLDAEMLSSSSGTGEKRFSWQCVGILKAYTEQVDMVALGRSGTKIATVGSVASNGSKTIHIWDVESYFDGGGFNLDDRVFLPCSAVALDWLESGNGQLLLGVATQNDIRVYFQGRESFAERLDIADIELQRSHSHKWFLLAADSLMHGITSLLWGPNASLVVTSSAHIYIYSQNFSQHRIAGEINQDVGFIPKSGDQSESVLSDSQNFRSSSRVAMETIPDEVVRSSQISMKAKNWSQDVQPYTLLGTADMWSRPLPAYHPTAVLYNLSRGNLQHARTCIRYLVNQVQELLPSTSVDSKGGSSTSRFLKIPSPCLSDFLQAGCGKQSTESNYINEKGISTVANSNLLGSITAPTWSFGEHLSSVNDNIWQNSSFEDLETLVATEERGMKEASETTKCGKNDHFTSEEVELLTKSLRQCEGISGLSANEITRLLTVINLLGEIDCVSKASQYLSLDQPGRRLWLAVHYARSYSFQNAGKIADLEGLVIESRAMAWALQSDCKENLLDLCLSGQLSWPAMRALGVGFWFTDIVQLRIWIEKLARAQYLIRKDPKDCALLYLALKRRNVLIGLLKLSKDEKDKVLAEFLARDFQDEKNQAAALKNAYTLLGKHRHELAVAFFLLGGDFSSAVVVCAKTLGDLQLALVICRLIEGSSGQMEHDLIIKHALPNTKTAGDSWLASLLQWLLGEKIKAVEELAGKLKSSILCMKSDLETGRYIHLVSCGESEIFDPDIGHYCSLLVAKPGLQAVLNGANARALSNWLASKTGIALGRVGLPLEALEHFTSSCERHSDHSQQMNMKKATAGFFSESCSDMEWQGYTLESWISVDVASSVLSELKRNLALQYQCQLLQDHPHWSCVVYASQNSSNKCHGRFNFGSENSGSGVRTGKYHYDFSKWVEEANEKFMENLTILERKFSADPNQICSALAAFAFSQSRHYFHCLLTRETCTKMASSCKKLSLAKDPSFFRAAVPFIGKAFEELPKLVAGAVLAGGGKCLPFWKGSILLQVQLKEVVRFAYDLRLLAASFLQRIDLMDEEVGRNTKYFKMALLLSYTLCVVAAWQGRHAQGLLILISPIFQGTSSSSFDESNLDDCLQALRSDEDLDELLENKVTTQPGTDNAMFDVLSAEYAWHVLGIGLWDCLHHYIKKQLSGVSDKVPIAHSPSRKSLGTSHPPLPSHLVLDHSSFGDKSTFRTNHQQISSNPLKEKDRKVPSSLNQMLPGIEETFEELFLNSLRCISSGVRRQFAFFLKHSSEYDQLNSLSVWLWGKECQFTKTAVATSVGLSLQQVSVNPVDKASQECWPETLQAVGRKNDALKKLWSLLVFREKLRSALEVEGLHGPKFGNHKKENCGWSMWKRSQARATSKARQNSMERSGNGNEVAYLRKDGEQAMKDQSLLERSVLERETQLDKPEEILHFNGELFEAMCVNSCCPRQVVIASNQKGLIYLDLSTHGTFSESQDNLWSQADWPKNGWAMSESTPVPTFVSPGVGLGSKEGSSLGLGGATVGLRTLPRAGKDIAIGGGAFGIPGYGGVGALGLGWEEWEDFDGFVDPPATVENVGTKALAAHPLRPLFLVGSSNTHVYLWEFGKLSAIATYGVLPAANVPPPYALASVSTVRFDRCGHRFATAAVDGTVCTWQLEVGGRSNVRPTESRLCFDRHASDVAFVGASGGILAATGSSPNGFNLIVWDTLAPPSASCASVLCHEGGARCLSLFDHDVGGGSISPLIVTGGKGGDIAVHDFRFIATGRAKNQRYLKGDGAQSSRTQPSLSFQKSDSSKNGHSREQNTSGMVWYIPKAHLGSISQVSVVPGTSLFLTGSKDGDVKLWDVKNCGLVCHWHKVHDKHMFLQHNSRGFGAVVQAAVTDVQPLPFGFLTCGGDGVVKLFRHPLP